MTGKTFIREFLNPDFGYFYRVRRVLRTHRTRYQNIKLVDTPELGKVMLLDGITQVAQKNEYQYHEPMAHGALCSHPRPQRVLIIGGGDGGICREVLRYASVTSVDIAELDAGVVAFSRTHLPTVHGGCFDDARVTVHVADGRAFVESHPRAYDVVIMDMTDPFGPSRFLYTREFFTAVKHSFRSPAGVFAMHCESPVVRPATFRLIMHTLADAFGSVRTMYPYIQMYAVLWSISVCSNAASTKKMSAHTINRRLSRAGVTGLKMFNGQTFAAMTVAFPYIQDILAKKTRIITDRRPDFPDPIGKQT